MVGTTARHGSGMQNVISYRFAFVAILRVLSSIILFSMLLILTNIDFTRAFFIYQNGHCRRRLGAGGGKTKPFMSISFWSKEASLGDRGGSKINELLWRLLLC